MSHIQHFAYAWFVPAIAFAVSGTGALLGLLLTGRARLADGGARAGWLIGAALSIGGTGIWAMHFVAMAGFSVAGTRIRYDVPFTVLSALLAVVVVGAGLFLVSRRGERPDALLGGGALTGLGVAGMHYLGMAAMNMNAEVAYDPMLVALSVLVAVVAATVALWFTLRVRGALATVAAALIMGVAVNGMHYLGMFAMRVRVTSATGDLPGADPIDFLLPVLTVVAVVTLGLLLAVALSPSERELRSESALQDRLSAGRERDRDRDGDRAGR
ncbi:MHYT domain-containing protein [Spongiactinospora sp. TRM90649]|uniref:MHYT domain-containing protein n=1 Tax=Spongiactinospora sp. TRM90649 TaxID=3031114 RepID=UPI0023F8EDAA|nr:MHYT domain-containing protein [Spongiactinospora sp. TRM90649]MDF5756762.1 MHYT domain-containing protein [Spongiactinospora sp. TRM90649]